MTLRTLDDSRRLASMITARRRDGRRRRRIHRVGGGRHRESGIGADVTVLEALPVPLGRVLGDGSSVLPVRRSTRNTACRCARAPASRASSRATRVRSSPWTTGARSRRTSSSSESASSRPRTGWKDQDSRWTTAWSWTRRFMPPTTCSPRGTWRAGLTSGMGGRCAPSTGRMRQSRVWQPLTISLPGGSLSEPFEPVPYIWSDQYDVKIQVLGDPRPDDTVEVVDGSIEDGRFVAVYGRDGKAHCSSGFRAPAPAHGLPSFGHRRGDVRSGSRTSVGLTA